ncbi:AraC-like DNA-binding protein [Paenibacillus amylolyticus]|uniref:AraC-like DNA-binding protein n=1 Tax=Paenibacillus amylolyticus TaxID=1451 RepID=A0AAP5LP79_PAEAM|nr:helix-turn-helix domain-containing protein [Paenibacillus amylolyticus]MDR6724400.1 AraC-like DNA-binding protein [Paenibacillus amylolyticus]
MNTDYLIQHVSTQLKADVYQYTPHGELVYTLIHYPTISSDASYAVKLKDFMLSIATNNIPIIATFNQLLYSIVTTPDHVFLVGPVRMQDPIALKHSAPDLGIKSDLVPLCHLHHLIQHLLLLNNLYSAEPITEEVLRSSNISVQAEEDVKRHFTDVIFHNQEVGRMHFPYAQEIREMSCIRNGDIDQLKKSWNEQIDGYFGLLAEDHLRSLKNVSIAGMTLACRAAIEGGVSHEMAYSLADSYIYKMEELSEPQSVQRLFRDAELEYTRMVYEVKRHKSRTHHPRSSHPRIELCKNYIFKHLHDKIYIKDMAQELDMNPNYLTELFYRKEGITIRDFIMQEKIKLARNLLMYSKYTYSEIATNLGFCSQSHFGKNFKSITQLTPKQYREIYGVRDYIQ